MWKSQFYAWTRSVLAFGATLTGARSLEYLTVLYLHCAAYPRGRGTTTIGTKRYEAHIQATKSEALEQARFSGTHEDSRREKDPCEEAGPGTRTPRSEDRLEVIE
jgi:hypothetical protein